VKMRRLLPPISPCARRSRLFSITCPGSCWTAECAASSMFNCLHMNLIRHAYNHAFAMLILNFRTEMKIYLL
jgi:hypothetical protein